MRTRARVLLMASVLWFAVASVPARAEARGFFDEIGKALLVAAIVGLAGFVLVSASIIPLAANGVATVEGERSSATWRTLGWIGGGVDLAVGAPLLVWGFQGLRRQPRDGSLLYAGVPATLLGIANLTLATTSELQPERP
jgi:hypothetical protein